MKLFGIMGCQRPIFRVEAGNLHASNVLQVTLIVGEFWEPLFSLMVLRIAFFMCEMIKEPSFSPEVLVHSK